MLQQAAAAATEATVGGCISIFLLAVDVVFNPCSFHLVSSSIPFVLFFISSAEPSTLSNKNSILHYCSLNFSSAAVFSVFTFSAAVFSFSAAVFSFYVASAVVFPILHFHFCCNFVSAFYFCIFVSDVMFCCHVLQI